MSFRDRWRARTDDARRTKGDPPPTYAQLLAQVRAAQEMAADLMQQAANLRVQSDHLIAENARLRTVVAEKTEYVEQLALELAEATARAKIPFTYGNTDIVKLDPTRHYASGPGRLCSCGKTHSPLDPDPTRPYIREREEKTYEATYQPAPEEKS